jgi:hypothetical protein
MLWNYDMINWFRTEIVFKVSRTVMSIRIS